MNIKIKYGEEIFKFNLKEELEINEDKINSELKEQPSIYGFLTLLHKKLIRLKEEAELEKDSLYSSEYIKWKDSINKSTNKVYSDDYCKHKALSNLKYKLSYKKFIKANEIASILGSCVKSFEQRKDMIQTMSANLRKEN